MSMLAPRPSIATIVLTTVTLASRLHAQCAQWTPGFGPATANGQVTELATIDLGQGPSLYAVGLFTTIGQAASPYIARFDGTAWSPFASHPGEGVVAIEAFDDGTGPAIHIATQYPSSIKKWNGSTWIPLGSGPGDATTSLAVYDDGTGPALYAAGFMWTVSGAIVTHIVKWNGVSWGPVGGGLDAGPLGLGPFALAVHDDGTGAALYVGGGFARAGGVPVNNIAKWDGSTWSALGSGIVGTGTSALVLALCSHREAGQPARLVAAGWFASAGGAPANNIASWDGTSWSALGSGSPSTIYALSGSRSAAGGALYAGGDFTQMGGVAARNVARWDGAVWSPVGGGVDHTVGSLERFDDGSGEALFATTSQLNPSLPTDNTPVERWDGVAWKDTVRNRGLDGPVVALTTFDDGAAPALVASGSFVHAGDVAANGIAQWDGAEWTPLGTGVDGIARTLFSYDDGTGTALYAGGTGLGFGGAPGSNIARWDGATWSSLGSGMDDFVRGFAAFDDGSGTALYAGGAFTTAGSISAHRVAKWNGSTWSALGSGLDDTVSAMTTFDDGGGTALYVGGVFTHAGGASANRVARWDGTSWSPLGSGLNAGVLALAVFDDGSGPSLYAGGQFSAPGSGATDRIARWDGTTWSPVGSGVHAIAITALCTFDDGTGNGDALYVAGLFEVPGASPPAPNIARWNGTSWTTLGSGLTAGGYWSTAHSDALAVFDDGRGDGADLYVGGTFTAAAPFAASNIARWKGCGEIGLRFCFGDGSDGACPCGNASAVGAREGCRNSTALGATLRGSGTASLATDSLVLRGAQMPDAPALYFQGTQSAAGGFGLAAGDGLLCIGGALTRMSVVMNSNGSSRFPAVGAANVSLAGGVRAPGTRMYQVHYRDVTSYCTADTFNFTNALRIVWTP
jgi:hypothetical protein